MAAPSPASSVLPSRPAERNVPWVCWLILPLAAMILSGIAREWADFVVGLAQGYKFFAG